VTSMITKREVVNQRSRALQRPEPHCTTPYKASRTWLAVVSLTDVPSDCGLDDKTVEPLGSTIFITREGRIIPPLLAIVLSIRAICIGVMRSIPCPKEFSPSWLTPSGFPSLGVTLLGVTGRSKGICWPTLKRLL